jgi:hypothetical protein
MRPPGVRTEILVPRERWRAPVAHRTLCAVARTPAGDIHLFRDRSSSTAFEARAQSWETWDFVPGDGADPLLSLADAAPPGFTLHARMRRGVHGTVAGREAHAHAVRALRPARRAVRLTYGTDELAFTLLRRRTVLTLTTGAGAGAGVAQIVAESRRGRWDIHALRPEVLAALAFFELADLATFLDSPLLDLL